MPWWLDLNGIGSLTANSSHSHEGVPVSATTLLAAIVTLFRSPPDTCDTRSKSAYQWHLRDSHGQRASTLASLLFYRLATIPILSSPNSLILKAYWSWSIFIQSSLIVSLVVDSFCTWIYVCWSSHSSASRAPVLNPVLDICFLANASMIKAV